MIIKVNFNGTPIYWTYDYHTEHTAMASTYLNKKIREMVAKSTDLEIIEGDYIYMFPDITPKWRTKEEIIEVTKNALRKELARTKTVEHYVRFKWARKDLIKSWTNRIRFWKNYEG